MLQYIVNVIQSTALLAVLFFCASGLPAQMALNVYNTFNTNFPDNTVNALALAPDHSLWVGTDNGLLRYDGSNWTLYQTSNSDLPSNYIRSIAFDLAGELWVGTFTDGLVHYDGTTWTNWNASNSPLQGDHVRCLAVDSASGMWIGTTSGLARLRDNTWTTWNFIDGGGESNNVASLAVYGTDTVWVGLVNGGLVYLTDTGFYDYTIHNSGLTDNTILGITLKTDDPWLATPAGGVVYFWNGAFIPYHPFNSGNPSSSMTSITQTPAGSYWVGSVDKGLVNYDGSGNWSAVNTATHPLMPQDHIRCVLWDAAGERLWAGTQSAGLIELFPDLVDVAEQEGALGGWQLFPQPSGGVVSLRGPALAAPLSLLDLAGRVVWRGHYQPPHQALDFSDLPAGSYMLLIQHPKGTVAKKVWLH